MSRNGCIPNPRSLALAAFVALACPPNMIARGAMFSLRTLWVEISQLNLEKSVPELKMPVFFIQGRHDHQVAAETSATHFEKFVAPSNKLVLFEDSAHMPPFEESDKFNALMADLVAQERE